MARGRITEASITAVREAARIDEVVSGYVTLKRTGGSLKGLCPFHDEKSPSFHVTPERGFYMCFGCQASGDVIKFLKEIESLDFVSAVEQLADRFRVDLTYEEYTGKPGAPDPAESRAARARLVAANAVAAEFFSAQLLTPEATDARAFLTDRGFDREAATQFGCGYAPNGWDITLKHLLAAGFTAKELTDAGLTSDGKNGPIDRFRGRLMFPIRDVSGEVIGFGARKLLPDDQDKGPKYLNTSETAIYKKSRVLFGLDKARKDISKQRRVVVVEGYTDVMACHLSGETTAVATCGTAFGEDHIRIIRRLLGDDGTGGEVIYTFDGDSAGQKAALRAFTMDDHFQTHTSVAVEPSGMDPCEVRISRGPEGVRALLDDRVPLFEFAIKSTLAQYDLATLEGRTNALAATTPIVAAIKHTEMRSGYIRQLARWTGSDIDTLHQAVLRATNTAPAAADPGSPTSQPVPAHSETPIKDASGAATPDPFERPDPSTLTNSRDALKVLLQNQKFVHLATAELRRNDFGHPSYQAVWDALIAADADPHTAKDPAGWVQAVREATTSPTVAGLVAELSVEPYHAHTGMTHETVLNTFLRLVQESCTRHLDWYERAIADPSLDPEKVLGLLERSNQALHRQEVATDRLNQNLLGTTPTTATN